jgi:hypothetical protein
MNEDLSDIQKLIRLKRYEQPPEDFVDDFMTEFVRRQRVSQMKRPWFAEIKDSISEIFSAWETPQWTLAAAAACVFMAVPFFMQRGGSDMADLPNVQQVKLVDKWQVSPQLYIDLNTGKSRIEPDLSPYLLGNHFSGGFRTENSDLSPSQVADLKVKPPIEIEPMFKFED